MNNIRRKALQKLASKIEEIVDELSELSAEETEAADAVPECFENRREEMEENAEYIDNAVE